MKYVVFMCGTLKILIANWPRTRKFSRLLQTGPREDRLDYKDRTRETAEIEPIGKTVAFDFSHHVTCWSRSTSNFYALIGQNLTGEFVYFDSWSWQSFVSTCDVFNCLFPLDVQNEIQLLSGVFCYSWLVCLLGFWLRNTSLVKVGNPISDDIVFVFTLLDA